jgi:sugar lactone lactonase YvrE
VFVGTGNDGQVLRIAADGTQSVFFDSAELEVHAIVPAPEGGLYVGTSPEGRIYRVDAKGAGSVYFDPDDKYIWALTVDSSGVLYVATGEQGIVYRVTAAGKGAPYYRTKATHARALAFDAAGRLIVGTESPGKVFRIDKDGSGFVLLDAGQPEISAVRVDGRGVIYATALSGRATQDRGPDRAPVETPEPAPIPTVSTEITSVAIVDAPIGGGGAMTSPARPERRSVRGALYRIQPDGIWDIVWNSQDDAPYDVLPEPDGSLLVATGNDGKVYRLHGEPTAATLIARADAQQVTGLVRGARGDLWCTTANSGKVLRISPQPATRGSYESDVRDAGTVATWGAITWHGSAPAGTSIRLFTRSGNTPVPDETWSAWSGAYTNAIGEQITSPKARYLQWKAELTGKAGASPAVTSVTIAYLQRNLRPDVSSISVYPPGVVFQKPFSSGDMEIAGFDGTTADRRIRDAAQNAQMGVPGGGPPLGRRSYERGLQTFLWKADDANDDELQYDIHYRREGETAWKLLKRGLSEPLYVWDTSSVPNGTYIIKVVASDGPANPPRSALSGERESQSFRIDNAPPVIEIGSMRRQGRRTIVEFSVRDEHSPVQRVEYSLDADRWRAIYPKDGIADSVVEHFELTLEADADGRALIIRAADAMENVATARPEAAAGVK